MPSVNIHENTSVLINVHGNSVLEKSICNMQSKVILSCKAELIKMVFNTFYKLDASIYIKCKMNKCVQNCCASSDNYMLPAVKACSCGQHFP